MRIISGIIFAFLAELTLVSLCILILLSVLSAARKAFGAFMAEYEGGGVASRDGRDMIFLQHLAEPGLEKTYVLNGHTNALLFVWKYYQSAHDYRALIVFGQGINWLISGNLEKYDTGDWSYYDQMGTRARESYHGSHIIQLDSLYGITGEKTLQGYAEKFASYSAAAIVT
jgi:heparosan-N-sulfate-glucuronate 5-epimerase